MGAIFFLYPKNFQVLGHIVSIWCGCTFMTPMLKEQWHVATHGIKMVPMWHLFGTQECIGNMKPCPPHGMHIHIFMHIPHIPCGNKF